VIEFMLLKEYFKLAKVFSYCEKIEGRKKLQKIIYILKEMGYPFYEEFDFHFYGPYSEQLTLEIEALKDLEIIKEEREDDSGWVKYIYRITENGKEWAKFCEDERLNNEYKIIKILNDKSARELELIATIIYFKELSKNLIIEKINTLKADKNYSIDEIENAIKFVKETCGISIKE